MAQQPLSYTLLIQLEPLVINPPIWRRLWVSGDITLRKLHHYIQAAMGWESRHLHEFSNGVRRYLPPEAEMDMAADVVDDRKARLRVVAKQGERLRYLYDFGDSWQHVIAVEAVEPCEQGGNWCHLLDGARACPPEDAGGADGYLQLLHTLAQPPCEARDELLAWLRGSYDAEAFDCRAANAAVQRVQNNFWG
ncbi:plasmid pRiA4b ORF-3 family protein [Pseudomonas typographi]|uniref:plasmid pRiA4b ORF-3 family protein n=1 Tax=Pseudomonas typographi TaxID=2715964 RepID=UPI001681CAE5|nr:plasmid pRiA4b ORF-3 family protein [Pseudomonas typographi]MBD1554651.1 plasmid pRiA4b ORF-3 family protein [Pseudomonas typographi]